MMSNNKTQLGYSSQKYDSDFPTLSKNVEGKEKIGKSVKSNASVPEPIDKTKGSTALMRGPNDTNSKRIGTSRMAANRAAANTPSDARAKTNYDLNHNQPAAKVNSPAYAANSMTSANPSKANNVSTHNPPSTSKPAKSHPYNTKASVQPKTRTSLAVNKNTSSTKAAYKPDDKISPPLPDYENSKAKGMRRDLDYIINDECGEQLELWMRSRMSKKPTSDINVSSFLAQIIKAVKEDENFFPKCGQNEALITLCWFRWGRTSISHGFRRYLLNNMAYYLSAIMIAFGEKMINNPDIVKKAQNLLHKYSLVFTPTFPYWKKLNEM